MPYLASEQFYMSQLVLCWLVTVNRITRKPLSGPAAWSRPARKIQCRISASTEFNRKGQADISKPGAKHGQFRTYGHADNNIPVRGAKRLAINNSTLAGPRSRQIARRGRVKRVWTPCGTYKEQPET
jgi:hypothetical protein